MELYISIPILVIFLLLSAFFASYEMAMSKVNINTLKKEAENGDKAAKRAYKMAINFDSSVSTVLFGNDFVNVGTSIAMLSIINVFQIQNSIVEKIVSIFLSVFVLLLFGEIVPKQLGITYNKQISKWGSSIIIFFKYLFLVFTFVPSKIGNLFAKISRKKIKEINVEVEDELSEMVDVIEEEGVFEKEKAEMLRSALEFNTTEAYEVMKPRVELLMFDINDGYNNFIKHKEFFVYSRIPIYDEDKDNIIGVLPIKLLQRKILANQPVDLYSLMYKPLFVPHSMKLSDVLLEFRKEKHHIAIVLDEFGGVEGALTMEDIIEELVGEIYDETDIIEDQYSKIRNGFVVDGAMNINDFFQLLDCENDDEKISYTTVGGWATEKIGEFAKEGDKFKYKNLNVTVIEVNKYTIEKIKVTKTYSSKKNKK